MTCMRHSCCVIARYCTRSGVRIICSPSPTLELSCEEHKVTSVEAFKGVWDQVSRRCTPTMCMRRCDSPVGPCTACGVRVPRCARHALVSDSVTFPICRAGGGWLARQISISITCIVDFELASPRLKKIFGAPATPAVGGWATPNVAPAGRTLALHAPCLMNESRQADLHGDK